MTALCWLCHGWGCVDKRPTGETSWSEATGGEHGERFPVYELHAAFASYIGELIECPICKNPRNGDVFLRKPVPAGTEGETQGEAGMSPRRENANG